MRCVNKKCFAMSNVDHELIILPRLSPSSHQPRSKWKHQNAPKYVGNFTTTSKRSYIVTLPFRVMSLSINNISICYVHCTTYNSFSSFQLSSHKKSSCPLMCSYSWRNPQSNNLIFLWRNILDVTKWKGKSMHIVEHSNFHYRTWCKWTVR